MNETLTEGSARLLTSLDAVVACEQLADLADLTAGLALGFLPGREVVVALRDGAGAVVTGRCNASPELEQRAVEALADGNGPDGAVGGPYLVHLIRDQNRVRGAIATPVSECVGQDTAQTLEGLGRLVATRAAQIEGKALTSAELQGTRSALGKGLHDLRTPLNSLRLGLHLLEPGLAGHEAAIMQRAQRAIDRMATLVTEMFDSLNRKPSAPS